MLAHRTTLRRCCGELGQPSAKSPLTCWVTPRKALGNGMRSMKRWWRMQIKKILGLWEAWSNGWSISCTGTYLSLFMFDSYFSLCLIRIFFIICTKKRELAPHTPCLVARRGFLGVFLMAAWPNAFFDLCGICCGHLLMPFWTFFLATLAGKAGVKIGGQVNWFSVRLLIGWIVEWANAWDCGQIDRCAAPSLTAPRV